MHWNPCVPEQQSLPSNASFSAYGSNIICTALWNGFGDRVRAWSGNLYDAPKAPEVNEKTGRGRDEMPHITPVFSVLRIQTVINQVGKRLAKTHRRRARKEPTAINHGHRLNLAQRRGQKDFFQ